MNKTSLLFLVIFGSVFCLTNHLNADQDQPETNSPVQSNSTIEHQVAAGILGIFQGLTPAAGLFGFIENEGDFLSRLTNSQKVALITGHVAATIPQLAYLYSFGKSHSELAASLRRRGFEPHGSSYFGLALWTIVSMASLTGSIKGAYFPTQLTERQKQRREFRAELRKQEREKFPITDEDRSPFLESANESAKKLLDFVYARLGIERKRSH